MQGGHGHTVYISISDNQTDDEQEGCREHVDGEDEEEGDGPCERPLTQLAAIAKEPDDKDMYITRSIVERYGMTTGCPGCKGKGTHSAECRRALTSRMKDDDIGIAGGRTTTQA